MRIKVLDKEYGHELLELDVQPGIIRIDGVLIKKDYSYYDNDIKVVEIHDNFITYLNNDYQIMMEV